MCQDSAALPGETIKQKIVANIATKNFQRKGTHAAPRIEAIGHPLSELSNPKLQYSSICTKKAHHTPPKKEISLGEQLRFLGKLRKRLDTFLEIRPVLNA